MNDLWIQIIAGLVVALISGFLGFLIKERIINQSNILPGKSVKDRLDYSNLDGNWHLYYFTRYPYLDSSPFCIHASQKIEIYQKNKVRGETYMPDHPSFNLKYIVQGEIRHGKMIVTDYCIHDETEFASIIYPDLIRPDLVGIWTGFDGENKLISAPVIMSRVERNQKELKNILLSVPINLISIEDISWKYYKNGEVIDS
ncbi:MAG: hypothetical protein PWQ55_1232 [Chloroflexota bacterium]|nr:hypothetical protein [Chloroflexota bacterium]